MLTLCTRQVSNEAHCIKVAADFLSVEALAACEALAMEFRAENLRYAWGDDVLQLNTQLYYAWISLERHLEDSRAPFQMASTSTHVKRSVPEPDDDKPRKKKFRGKPNEQLDSKRCYKCTHCPKSEALLYDHGIRQHLYVMFSFG